jgi:predicted nucleic acid-binding Zn ribbon protein
VPAEDGSGNGAGRSPGSDLAKAALARAQADARKRGVRARDRARRRADPLRSGAGPDERDPQPLARAVERLLSERGWETPAAVAGVMSRWAEIVGDEVAAHCRPESHADNELVVVADSSAWASQLRLLAPTLVRRLDEVLGHGTIVRVRVVGPVGPSWRRGPRSVRGRGPRDTYG